MRLRLAVVVLGSLFFAACTSTPRHSNTLIFGTTTKVAIDASQAPTGAVGVTIGFARQEAVWMPLLANQDSSGALVPAECGSDDDCKIFAGRTGDGGAAGRESTDTYSVFASFGGEAKGNAGAGASDKPGAGASVALAQYFATGIAARLLAEHGGAALVNTAAPAAAADVVAAQKTLIAQESGKVDSVMAYLTKSDGTLDTAKRDKLIGDAKLADSSKTYLKGISNPARLRDQLSLPFDAYGKPLYEALPKT